MTNSETSTYRIGKLFFNKNFILLLILFLLQAIPLSAQGLDHSHSGLDSILKKYIVNGLVNYKSLSQNRNQLTDYLKNISDYYK